MAENPYEKYKEYNIRYFAKVAKLPREAINAAEDDIRTFLRDVNIETYKREGPAVGERWRPLNQAYLEWKRKRKASTRIGILTGGTKEIMESRPYVEHQGDTWVFGWRTLIGVFFSKHRPIIRVSKYMTDGITEIVRKRMVDMQGGK